MRTNQCPVCSSDVIIEEGSQELDLVSCLNCGAELEIVTLHPLLLEPLAESDEEDEEKIEE